MLIILVKQLFYSWYIDNYFKSWVLIELRLCNNYINISMKCAGMTILRYEYNYRALVGWSMFINGHDIFINVLNVTYKMSNRYCLDLAVVVSLCIKNWLIHTTVNFRFIPHSFFTYFMFRQTKYLKNEASFLIVYYEIIFGLMFLHFISCITFRMEYNILRR